MESRNKYSITAYTTVEQEVQAQIAHVIEQESSRNHFWCLIDALEKATLTKNYNELLLLAASLKKDDDEAYLLRLVKILYDNRELLKINLLYKDAKNYTALEHAFSSGKEPILEYFLHQIDVEINLLAYQTLNNEDLKRWLKGDISTLLKEHKITNAIFELFTIEEKYREFISANDVYSKHCQETNFDHPANIKIYQCSR